jgi:hypothetical protein
VASVLVGKVRIGYLDEQDAGWLPVSASIENAGAETTVTLVAAVKASKGEPLWTSEKTVTLPARSRRVELLYVRLEDGATNVWVEIRAGRNVIQTSSHAINWRSNTGRAARTEPPIPVHALLVHTGEEERPLLSWLEPAAAAPGQPVPVVLSSAIVEPRELPDRPSGYDGIDLVLLAGTNARDFDEPRRRSLLAWVRGGGRVVLLPGGDPAWLRDDLVKALLPPDAEPGRVERVPLARLAALVAPGRVPEADMYVVRSSRLGICLGGEVVNGKRVADLTIYKHGAGDVALCAFDLGSVPFTEGRRWGDALGRMFLAENGSPRARTRSVYEEDRLEPWFQKARDESELPSPLLLIPVVVFYILCMGPLNQLVVRRSSTPVMSVVTIPAIALVFTVVCFTAGYFWRGTSTLTDRLAVIATHPGEDTAHEWAGLRIRSASSTNYTVSSDRQLVARQGNANAPQGGEAGAAAAARVGQDGDRFEFADLPLSLWERAFFQAEGPYVLGGAFTIEVTPTSARIQNGTKLDLGPGVIFLHGTKGFRVPPIAAGAEATIDGSKEAAIEGHDQILAVVAESEPAQKAATNALDGFLPSQLVEITYVASARNATPSFAVAGAQPDRDLALVVVEGEDRAREEEIYHYARNVNDQRAREDYDDAIAHLAKLAPSSARYREAVELRAYLETSQRVASGEDLYEKGDLDGALAAVRAVEERPELERDAVSEIRKRAERWREVARSFDEAASLVAQDPKAARAKLAHVLDLEPLPEVSWHAEAQERIAAIDAVEEAVTDGAASVPRNLASGHPVAALVLLVRLLQSGKALPDDLEAALAGRRAELEGLERACPETALGRAEKRELRLLIDAVSKERPWK